MDLRRISPHRRRRLPNLIPASGWFGEGVELSLVLASAETWIIRGQSVTIQLHGEPSHIEEFRP
ncbi:MAG: hypothetical protein WDN28_12575 [Chthoniobacter sp.]